MLSHIEKFTWEIYRVDIADNEGVEQKDNMKMIGKYTVGKTKRLIKDGITTDRRRRMKI